MEQINLKVKTEVLSGLCGELEKKQADFENYAESVLKEALKANGNEPVRFHDFHLYNKNYEPKIIVNTLSVTPLRGVVLSCGENVLSSLENVLNRDIVRLVERITEAVENK